jgi:hypothetical protein
LLKSEFSLLSSSYFCLLHVFEFLGISWVEMKNTFSTPPMVVGQVWERCGRVFSSVHTKRSHSEIYPNGIQRLVYGKN